MRRGAGGAEEPFPETLPDIEGEAGMTGINGHGINGPGIPWAVILYRAVGPSGNGINPKNVVEHTEKNQYFYQMGRASTTNIMQWGMGTMLLNTTRRYVTGRRPEEGRRIPAS